VLYILAESKFYFSKLLIDYGISCIINRGAQVLPNNFCSWHIPRIVNSKSTTHSVIWLLGVLTCASILLWQLTVLFRRYQSYPANTVLIHSVEGDNATFPDVTICNLESTTNRKRKITILPNTYVLNATISSQQFQNYMKQQFHSQKYDIKKTVNDIFRAQLHNPIIFFNSIIQNNLSFTREDSPIINCLFTNWDYSTNQNSQCILTVQQQLDPDYTVCYTMSLNNSDRKNIRALSVFIYVNSF